MVLGRTQVSLLRRLAIQPPFRGHHASPRSKNVVCLVGNKITKSEAVMPAYKTGKKTRQYNSEFKVGAVLMSCKPDRLIKDAGQCTDNAEM